MRVFLAFKIPQKIMDVCISVQEYLKNCFGEDVCIKWVEPQNLHVTLLFLGYIDDNQIDRLITNLNLFRNYDRLNFFLKDLNWKGIGRIPNVLWLNLGGDLEKAKILHRNIKKTISSFDIKLDPREFLPHITLGRVKYVKNRSKIETSEIEISSFIKGKDTFFVVDSFYIFSSELTGSGPIYKAVSSVGFRA